MSNNGTVEGISDSKDYEVPAILSNEVVLFPGMEIVTVVKERRNLSALNEAMSKHQILAFIPASKSEARSDRYARNSQAFRDSPHWRW